MKHIFFILTLIMMGLAADAALNGPGLQSQILPMKRGGTGANITPSAGKVVYSTSTKLQLTAAGTSGQCLQSAGSGTPTWGSCGMGSAITSLNGQSGATQVFANDTNVIVTSSNNTHTLGWASVLSIARGGSNNSSLGPVLGGVIYTDATKLNTLAAGTSGQVLKSNGAAAPSWGTDTSGITSLNSQAGVTQVFANDTNVLITSSNNTHTLGWSGALSIARGGSNNGSLGPVLGGVIYSDASKLNVLAAGTAGLVLTANGASVPSWAAASDATKLPLAGGVMSGAINMGGNLINNMATPVSGTDSATKAYVDNLINGLTWKASCDEATTAALPANTYNNGSSGVGATITEIGLGALSIDGTSPAIADRVLVKNEGTASHNGIYVVTIAGSGAAAFVLTRSADFNQSSEITQGDTTFIENGTVNSTTSWSLTTADPVTIGTDSLNFVQVSGPGSIIAGTGISISGSTVSLVTPVVISSGGTNNASLGPVLGGVIYADATKLNTLAAGTSGQVLKSNGAASPSWGTDVGITSLNSQAGVTQVFANDTNVVITSSNNTHTLGFSGTISISRGGTANGSLGPVLGGIIYSDATKLNTLAAGTSGQILSSAGAASPTWLSVVPIANGGTNNGSLGPVLGGVVYTDATKLATLAAGTSGQVLKSNGAAAPSWATDTSGITSLNSQAGATQVFANDTNVLITSSNNTHTLSWGSTLGVSRGGTGAGSYTAGSIPYSNGTILTQDNANLFWDGTNHRLGIGTVTPSISVHASQGSVAATTTGGTVGFVQLWNDNALIWQASGTQAGLRFGSATDLAAGSFSEKMKILDGGNVGIGTSSPTAKLQVAGQIVSSQVTTASGATVDFSTGNVQVLQSVGGTAITLNNMVDGGIYTVVVTDATARTYTFTNCTNAYFVPANGATIASTRTVYSILKTTESAATRCYISWVEGFQ